MARSARHEVPVTLHPPRVLGTPFLLWIYQALCGLLAFQVYLIRNAIRHLADIVQYKLSENAAPSTRGGFRCASFRSVPVNRD